MKNKKKHILILGGSSDIGIEVIKNFLKLKWEVTAHFSQNKKKLEILRKYSNSGCSVNFGKKIIEKQEYNMRGRVDQNTGLNTLD